MEREASAFKIEFYERAKREQVREDLVSYLGEYRFEIPEFSYKLGIKEGKLTDPTSGEFMTDKAEKAIVDRGKDGLNTSREFAELSGLNSLESQIQKKRKELKKSGNEKIQVVWLSPQGSKEEGYGDYGFGYVGELEGDELKMTAIRLESPTMADFNRASIALFGEEFNTAEEFLSSPRVIDVNQEEIKQFIKGNFYIKDEKWGRIFDQSVRSMRNIIEDCVDLIMYGTEEQKHTAMHVIENMSLELKAKYEKEMLIGGNIEFIPVNLSEALTIKKYILPPPKVLGSCGATSGKQSNDIFRGLGFQNKKSNWKEEDGFKYPGPCRMCGRDINCGPCKICESCNNRIDLNEIAA